MNSRCFLLVNTPVIEEPDDEEFDLPIIEFGFWLVVTAQAGLLACEAEGVDLFP